MTRLRASLLVAAACALPRLGIVVYEGERLLDRLTEKSDQIAATFVESGTFGFLPDVPTAYTQPLYGFFLAPIYEVFGRSWLAVGVAQTLVAVATALLVLELGRRVASLRVGVLAALLTTVHPYVVWHDVHVNREVLDGLLAVGLTYLTVLLAERRTWPLAAALGLVAGIAILGNARLVLLPVVLLAYLAWRWGDARATLRTGAIAGVAAAVAIAPWVVRNEIRVGCYAITTDARALWKANNEHTYETLERGLWIDDVPELPGAPPSPELAAALALDRGEPVPVDECAQMELYQGEVLEFWREQPGEKAKLAGQAATMLWNPFEQAGESARSDTGFSAVARSTIEPAYLSALYLLAFLGAAVAGRRIAVLVVALLAYQTVVAMIFVGTTRYRVPWDFLLALLAAAALRDLARRRRRS